MEYKAPETGAVLVVINNTYIIYADNDASWGTSTANLLETHGVRQTVQSRSTKLLRHFDWHHPERAKLFDLQLNFAINQHSRNKLAANIFVN